MIDNEPRPAIVRAGEAWTDERADEMRAISEERRRELIEETPNCLGYDRFQHRSKQVMLREAYRKPKTPGTGGKA